ncbi:MAG TPA: DUF2238 domain-containing protein [Polyangiaceae bacterium]|nr:DUF2238 domain-containing protein [Polyangiaceae bacterium]
MPAALRRSLMVVAAALIASAINPHDYFTWFLEVVPALVVYLILLLSYQHFALSPLLYWLIAAHACVLAVGGHYTYAEVPLFDWIKDALHQSRNNYDKLGHFMQGFVPAIAARELLLRRSPLKRGKWLIYIVISICLAFSAFYELIEWWVAAASGDSAEAFLGTQGYVWDTQSDMMMALIGAVTALITLSRFHDQQLSKFT